MCVSINVCVTVCVSRVCVCHIYRDGHGMCVCTTVTVCVTVYYDVCQTPTTVVRDIFMCVTVCHGMSERVSGYVRGHGYQVIREKVY